MTMEFVKTLGSKVERMDRWIATVGRKPSASEIAQLIELIYRVNIEQLPASSSSETAGDVIQDYLEQCGAEVSGRELRQRLNLILGVNLDALSALEGARISIYSKNQWMLREDTDLFIIHTGVGDADVRIYPTPYFWMQSQAEALPDDFMHAMLLLGYDYDQDAVSHSYCNPSGVAVADSFKGQTIRMIRQMISRSYSYL